MGGVAEGLGYGEEKWGAKEERNRTESQGEDGEMERWRDWERRDRERGGPKGERRTLRHNITEQGRCWGPEEDPGGGGSEARRRRRGGELSDKRGDENSGKETRSWCAMGYGEGQSKEWDVVGGRHLQMGVSGKRRGAAGKWRRERERETRAVRQGRTWEAGDTWFGGWKES